MTTSTSASTPIITQKSATLATKIEDMRDKCNAALASYRMSTEGNTSDYRGFLARDATLSKHVEQKLRQVERMQSNITAWKLKILQNKQECEVRNAHLRSEKMHLQQHFQDLKGKMNKVFLCFIFIYVQFDSV